LKEWNKIILTPQDLHDKILKLVAMIPEGKYTYVYGIPRGGLIVAAYLSHWLDLQILSDLKEVNYLDSQPILLIADDVSDTGITLSWFKGYDAATIHYKPRSIIRPTYFVDQCANDDWIVYPYERVEEVPNREL